MNSIIETIAIVGGGSVATSFLYQFLNELSTGGVHRNVRVLVFEPQMAIGPGGAYQHDNASNLLNIPAASMSAIASERSDFVRWLRQQSTERLSEYGVDTVDPAGFYPRPLFGLYLRDVYRRASELARQLGVELLHVRTTIKSLRTFAFGDQAGVIVLAGDNGVGYCASRVVLCNGNLPSVAFPELTRAEGFFNSPYPVKDLCARISPEQTVGILGTSLSAIDAIVALQAAGHRGRIVSISRGGRLPSVRSPNNHRVSLRDIGEARLGRILAAGRAGVTLTEVSEMLMDALRRLGGGFDQQDVLGFDGEAVSSLGKEIALSQAGPRPWQSVASATNEHVEHIWTALDAAERHQFLRQWKGLWMARRAMFPMRNALKVHALLTSGQLSVLDGFEGVELGGEASRFTVKRRRGAGSMEIIPCDWVINATSFSTDVQQTLDPLIRDLIQQGIAAADPFGGVRLDFDTGCVIRRDGQKDPRVSLMGSLATGTYFWTASMEVNARLAEGQAVHLAHALRTRETGFVQQA